MPRTLYNDPRMASWKYDVVIVGAGPAGITAAIALAKADVPVLVIEAGAVPARRIGRARSTYREPRAADVLGEEAVANRPTNVLSPSAASTFIMAIHWLV